MDEPNETLRATMEVIHRESGPGVRADHGGVGLGLGGGAVRGGQPREACASSEDRCSSVPTAAAAASGGLRLVVAGGWNDQP